MPTTPPRWLNDEERRAWLAYVDFSTLLADYLNRQLRRDAGMTHADYSLLAYLSMTPDGTLGMSDLAQRLKITRSRLTHAVNRLRDVGLVDRREDPADGRGQLAVLTDEGRAMLEEVAPGH
ncbi:MarR family winged helix-turn-helix transcriptional regulator, partial [Streptomyces sp. NPDC002920]